MSTEPLPTPALPPLPGHTLPLPSAPDTAPRAYTGNSPEGYEIVAELGRGGMGVVYQARQGELNRLVALKMILAGPHAGSADLARFLAEAKTFAHLQHPNIVQIFESGQHAGLPFLTLEYVAGGTLADKVRTAPLPPRQAAQLVEQLASGMAYAHARGIVHRDLKPENVLLATDGTPKITDFGLAKRVDSGSNLTATGAVMGTPSYMAPEQASGKTQTIGPPADIYALGAILYRLLTGRPPFQAASALDTLLQVVETEPVPPTQLQPQIPRDLETICLKCLQKEPAKRYGSAQALAEDLHRFLHQEPIAARPVGNVERLIKWARRRPSVATLLAVLLFTLLSGITISTYFALEAYDSAAEARNQARVAGEKEQLAQEQSRLAAEKTRLVQQAARDLEMTLARGLLRPLGHDGASVSETELDALWELAAGTNKEVRFLFLEQALEKPETAAQVYRRAELAAQAVVGLDPVQRQKVVRLLILKLQAAGADPRVRLACVALGVALGTRDRTFAEPALAAVEEEIYRTSEPNSQMVVIRYFHKITANIDPETAGSATADVVRYLLGLQRKNAGRPAWVVREDPFQDDLGLRDEAILLLTERLPPDQARQLAEEAVQHLIDRLAKSTNPAIMGRLASTLFTAVTRIDPSNKGGLAAQASVSLLEQMLKTTNAGVLSGLGNALQLQGTDQVPAGKGLATAVAMHLLDLMAATKDVNQLYALTSALQAAAMRLEEPGAALATRKLVDQMVATDNALWLSTLLQAFGNTAKLDAGESALAADRLSRHMARLSDSRALQPLSSAAWTVMERLGRRQKIQLAARIVPHLLNEVDKTSDPQVLSQLTYCTQLFVDRAGCDPASVKRLFQQITRTKDANALAVLLTLWMQIMQTQRQDQAAAMNGAIMIHLLDEMARVNNVPDQLNVLAGALAMMSQKLTQVQKAQAAQRLVDQWTITKNIVALASLANALQVVEADLTFEQAAQAMDHLAASLASSSDPNEWGPFGTCWSIFASRQTAVANLRTAQALLKKLLEDSDPILAYCHASAFDTVLRKLEAKQPSDLRKQALTHLLKRVLATEDPAAVAYRLNCVSLFLDRVEPEEAKQLGQPVLEKMAATADASILASYVTCFQNVFDRLGPEQQSQQKRLASHIMDQIVRSSNRDTLLRLVYPLQRFMGSVDRDQAARFVPRLLDRLAWSHDEVTVAHYETTVKHLLTVLTRQDLVELLKQPTCTTWARGHVLSELGKRCQRTFADVWDFVDYARINEPGLDLTSPLRPR